MRPVITKWNWGCWSRVLQVARDYKCGIIHIQYQTAAYGMHPAINLLPLRVRREYSRPRILVTFHDLREPYLFPKAGSARHWVNQWLARYSDAIITTNAEDEQELRHWVLPTAPHLIPIGSNIHPQLPEGYDRAARRARLGVSEGETLLCYFGFLNASKGGETLLRALAELLQRKYPVRLLMVGGQVGASDPTNIAYLQRVQALADQWGLTQHILWTGFTQPEQVSANLMAADIGVLPYRDGASFRRGSFMAALAHGLPIVSTQPRASIPALIDGQNILLVPPDDAAAVATAIERVIESPELRTRLAHGAAELAKGFAWDTIAMNTVQLYGGLLLGAC